MSRCAPASVAVFRGEPPIGKRDGAAKKFEMIERSDGWHYVSDQRYAIRALAANAARTETGSTWMPSMISPAVNR